MTSCAMVLYLPTALCSIFACCILFWPLTMLTSSFSLGCHQWLKVVYAIVIYANIVCIVCYASDGIGWTNFIKLEMLSSRVVCWPWFCRITNTWQSTCPPPETFRVACIPLWLSVLHRLRPAWRIICGTAAPACIFHTARRRHTLQNRL